MPFTAISLLASLLLIVGILNPDASLLDMTTGAIATERDSGDPMSLTGRVDVWKTILEYAAQRPLFGYGHDAFWSPSRIEDISKTHQWSINQAHNAYLEWLVNLGLVGLCLYMVAMVRTWVVCTRRFITGSQIYGFASSIILFIMLHNCLESINALPLIGNFLAFIVLFHEGFIRSLSQNK
jgi:O-antigen ligase